VYNTQSEDIRAFLRRTAVLDDMTPTLCNRLLDRRDARQMLTLIEDRNLFVSHVERETDVAYRYHHLFQQFLLAKCDELGETMGLHARAAELLESDGEAAQAIAHYHASQLHNDAARVIAAAAPSTYESNHWHTLAGWVDALPADVLREHPRLLWYRARIYTQQGQLDDALAVFGQAESGFKQRCDTTGVVDVLVSRATSLRLAGRLKDAQEGCEMALALLTDMPSGRSAAKSAAEARRTIGICQVQSGHLDAGTEELRRSLALYEEAEDKFGAANLHSDLGTALRMVGNMAASDIHFDQAVTLWNDLGASASLANTLNNIGVGHHLRGNYAKALEVYERALAIAQDTALTRVQAIVLTGMGDVYRDLGQCDQAFAAYNEARPIAERASEALLVSYILDALGNTYILTGDFVRAGELIRQAYEQARERKSRQAATLYFASLGVLCYERGEPKTAIEYLSESATVLQEIGARRDLPKVRLHLANAYYLNGQWDLALTSLEAMFKDTFTLGYDQFLDPIARRTLPLLRFAFRQKKDDDRLAELLKRVEQTRPTSAPESPLSPVVSSATPGLRIYGFGDVRVMVGDKPVDQRDWGTAKAKEMLFYLLSFPHRSKEQIGSVFWADLSVARVRSAFHVTIYRLRRALHVPDCILYDEDRYAFNHHIEYWYDVQEFERLLAQAERIQESNPDLYETYLKQAVALYRGDFLESLALGGVEWHTSQAEALRRKYTDSLLSLARAAIAKDDFEHALEYYRRVARKDSYLEVAHRGIMEAYVRMGDRNAALRHYRDLETHLQNELGVSPTPETMRLFEEITKGG
jgi:ATP/maltotriose-dependent transcriptional regulator MalT